MPYEIMDVGLRAGWGSTVEQNGDAGVIITWTARRVGFGEFTLTQTEGRLTLDTEDMSKEFFMAVAEALWDKAHKEAHDD